MDASVTRREELGADDGELGGGARFPFGDARNGANESNVVAEMQALKDAGFTVVRLYGDPGKTWVAVIKAADTLGMQVVYQLAPCESESDDLCVGDEQKRFYDDIEGPQLKQLADVITTVGRDVFQRVVKLVIVGNEVLWTDAPPAPAPPTKSNAAKLVHTIEQTKAILASNCVSVSMSVALQADVWIDDAGPGRKDLANALPPGDPIAINAYPFQWSVPVAEAMDPTREHSLPYYVDPIQKKYGRPVVISETGWASAGVFDLGSNHAKGAPAAAEQYYKALYAYVTAQKGADAQLHGVRRPDEERRPQLQLREHHLRLLRGGHRQAVLPGRHAGLARAAPDLRDLRRGVPRPSARASVIVSMLATWMLTAAIVIVILMTPTLMQRLYGIAPTRTLIGSVAATLTLSIVAVGALLDRFGAVSIGLAGGLCLIASTDSAMSARTTRARSSDVSRFQSRSKSPMTPATHSASARSPSRRAHSRAISSARALCFDSSSRSPRAGVRDAHAPPATPRRSRRRSSTPPPTCGLAPRAALALLRAPRRGASFRIIIEIPSIECS